eukprot:gene690-2502_t
MEVRNAIQLSRLRAHTPQAPPQTMSVPVSDDAAEQLLEGALECPPPPPLLCRPSTRSPG